MARQGEGRRPAGGSRKAGGRTAGERKGAAAKAAGRKRATKKAAARKGSARKAAPRGAARKTAAKRPAAGKAAARRPAGGMSTGARRVSPTSKATGARRGATPSTSGRRGRLWIDSPGQHAERPGQTLATRNHDVIRQWAEARGAVPATVPGTERDGRPGVLRFDFPDFGGRRLRQVDWDEWFQTFDERNLVFLFQEQLKSGRQSNFFRLDNPERPTPEA